MTVRRTFYTGERWRPGGFRPEQQTEEFAMKPKGLWYGCEGQDQGSTWKDFITSEMNHGGMVGRYEWLYEIKINFEKILKIRTPWDMYALAENYGITPRPAFRTIDWQEVAKDYSGIEICPYQWDFRLNTDFIWYYGWDVASGCIWKEDAIKSVELIGHLDPRTLELTPANASMNPMSKLVETKIPEQTLIVICGPAATGKSSVARELKKLFGDEASIALSYYTRKKRKKERRGVDGHFISRNRFLKMKEDGEFTAPNGTDLSFTHYGKHYGRTVSELTKTPVVIVDASFPGLRAYRKANIATVFSVFIMVNRPREEWKKIIRSRGEPEDIVEWRVKKGLQMMDRKRGYPTMNFDVITMNEKGKLKQAAREVYSQVYGRLDTSHPEKITAEYVRKKPETLFVFGDNDMREGKKGQAQIRDERNTIGLRTKKAPKGTSDAYYTDEEYRGNISKMNNDLKKIQEEAKKYQSVYYIPGIGEGYAKLQKKAPRTYEWLKDRINPVRNPPKMEEPGQWWWFASHEGCKKGGKPQKITTYGTREPDWTYPLPKRTSGGPGFIITPSVYVATGDHKGLKRITHTCKSCGEEVTRKPTKKRTTAKDGYTQKAIDGFHKYHLKFVPSAKANPDVYAVPQRITGKDGIWVTEDGENVTGKHYRGDILITGKKKPHISITNETVEPEPQVGITPVPVQEQ